MFKSTPKQAAASRANAQKSTGPRTSAGKSVSRFNALKHGIYAVHQIMFDEKPEDLAELAAEYHELYSPADSKQRFLVDTLVANEWRLRRTRRVEAELWLTASNAFLVKNIETTITCTSGDAFATDSFTFERLQRVVNSCERAWHRADKELERLKVGQALSSTNAPANATPNPSPTPPQAEPAANPAPPPQPQEPKPTSPPSASFRKTPQTPPPATPKSPQTPPSAPPDAGANPSATQPSTPDRAPKPPETA